MNVRACVGVCVCVGVRVIVRVESVWACVRVCVCVCVCVGVHVLARLHVVATLAQGAASFSPGNARRARRYYPGTILADLIWCDLAVYTGVVGHIDIERNPLGKSPSSNGSRLLGDASAAAFPG